MTASSNSIIAIGLTTFAASLAAAPAMAQDAVTIPPTLVTASRLQDGIRGTSTTIITGEEIARDPAATLQDILARQPGVQVRHLFGGGTAGARDTVDMRGFGAAATANTLVLVNGRRLNDIDLAGVDFTAIPRDSIERIEIIRGNSAAVLYGDGAAGGAINIVTKSAGPSEPHGKLNGGMGSYGYREGGFSAGGGSGATAFTAQGNLIESDGYRRNNELLQRNVGGEARHKTATGELYLNLSASDQHLGLPGGREVTATSSELTSDRRGTSTPFDYADTKGLNLSTGGTTAFSGTAELIVDGGVRHKSQQAATFYAPDATYDSYFAADLTTWSLTPRLNLDHDTAGLPATSILGIDLYYANYESDRANHRGDAPIHRYNASQQTYAVYGQQTLELQDNTELALGLRLQHVIVSATDRLNTNAPGYTGDTQGLPLDDKGETQWAAHLGLEHKFNKSLALFGRTGRSMRLPTIDERVGMSPFGSPTTFDLKTQTSYDVETGMKGKASGITYLVSGYIMELENELHFSSATFTNTNLAPTRRSGIEASTGAKLADGVSLKTGGAYTKAEFREGANAGNDIPLVSRWTGNVGLGWDIVPRFLIGDLTLRYVGERRLDNDQRNVQPTIPGHTLVDIKASGKVDSLYWSLAINNLFDVDYFDYGIASAFTLGTYNAYPQAGRTVMFKLGAEL